MGLYKSYEEYIKSDTWKEIRAHYIKDACEICGTMKYPEENKKRKREMYEKFGRIYMPDKSIFIIFQLEHNKSIFFRYQKLHLHHRNYKDCGNEQKEDVITLCETCHFLVHKYNLMGFETGDNLIRAYYNFFENEDFKFDR